MNTQASALNTKPDWCNDKCGIWIKPDNADVLWINGESINLSRKSTVLYSIVDSNIDVAELKKSKHYLLIQNIGVAEIIMQCTSPDVLNRVLMAGFNNIEWDLYYPSKTRHLQTGITPSAEFIGVVLNSERQGNPVNNMSARYIGLEYHQFIDLNNNLTVEYVDKLISCCSHLMWTMPQFNYTLLHFGDGDINIDFETLTPRTLLEYYLRINEFDAFEWLLNQITFKIENPCRGGIL